MTDSSATNQAATIQAGANQALIAENASLEQRIRELEKAAAEQKLTESALRESEERYRTIFNNHRAAICILDMETGRFVDVNEAQVSIYGYSREELLSGMSVLDMFADHEESLRSLQSADEAGTIFIPLRWHRKKDGTVFPVEIFAGSYRWQGRRLMFGVALDISKRQQAQDALQESESKFRDLSEKSIAGIYLIQDNVFKYVNSEFARICGYAISGMTDRLGPRDVIHPEDLPLVLDSIRQRISGEVKSVSYGFRIVTGSGEIRHAEVYSSSTVYQGKPAVIGTLLDVTDRRQMEEALRESEEKYRSIFENATEGIYQSTQEGRFIRVNPAMARIWGYGSPEEMMEKITDVEKQHYVDPQGRNLFKSIMEEQGSVDGLKVEIYRRDRSRIWVSLNARAVYDQNGNLLYYEGTTVDITDQKLMEEMIRENERRYRHLVEHSNDIVYTTDLEGFFTYLNPATEKVTGFPVSQLFGKHFHKLLREDYRKSVDEFYIRQLTEGLAATYYEFPIVTRDGTEKWIGQETQIIFEKEEAVGFQATARDITDRLKAEEAQLQREKLDAVIEMAGGICHEMNQPLQIISGLTDLMIMRTAEDHPLYRSLDKIRNSVERLAVITKRLMGITKYETKAYIGCSKIIDIDKSSH